MNELQVMLPAAALAFVPLVLTLTQLAKMYTDSKWSPLWSLAFGFLCAYFVPVDWFGQYLLNGLLLGLTPMGLYSGTKSVLGDK